MLLEIFVLFTKQLANCLQFVFSYKLLRVMNVVKTYIGLADFFSGKVLVSNNYRCAFIHFDALMNALRYRCTF